MRRISILSTLPDRIRKIAFAVLVGGVLLWVGFFDSYSLYSRISLAREKSILQAENDRMKAEIAAIEALLERELTDEEIEKIAREEYGMSRSNETVYPVVKEDP